MNKPKRCVLIVDDEIDIREMLKTVFELEDFNVITAGGGQEAYEMLKTNQVNVIISDVRMPLGDGVELLKKVRAEYKDTPVIFLITGYAKISREEAIDLGAQDMLFKPYDIEELTMKVNKLFQK